MLVALFKKNNAADGRFGRALRGLQRFPISALMFFDRPPVCLQNIALTSKSAEGQTLPGIGQRFLKIENPPPYCSSLQPDPVVVWSARRMVYYPFSRRLGNGRTFE